MVRRFRWVLRWALVVGVVAGVLVARAQGPASGPDGTAVDAAPAATAGSRPLGLPKAVVLGVVEGLTEYLPVSSTGHLFVTQRWLGIGRDPAERNAATAYMICIQIGAILACLGLYPRRFMQLLKGVFRADPAGRRLLWSLLIAFSPAAVIGLLFGGVIKDLLFGVWPIVLGWVGGSVAILVFQRLLHNPAQQAGEDEAGETAATELETMSMRQALTVGVTQCAAFCPGVSRSLATILGARGSGLSIGAAVEFSFLLGAITLSAATGHELLSFGSEIATAYGVFEPLVGVVVAGVFAAISMRWMVDYLKRRGLGLFAWYRFGIAAVTVVTVLLKWPA